MSVSTQRRQFLKQSLLGTAGLIIGVKTAGAGNELVKIFAEDLMTEINPFVLIDAMGKITLVNSRPDMGQGSHQAVSSLIAEELEVRLDQIQVISSDGRAKYGDQSSGGSSTVRGLWTNLRQAGAAAKEMLMQAAANKWNTTPDRCHADDGIVYLTGTDKKMTYGALAAEAAKLEIPKNPKLKDPKEFKILGKYHKRLDIPSKVLGSAVYGIDVVVPGMLYATTLHAPSVQGKLISFDDAAAKMVPGVKNIIKTKHEYPGGTTDALAIVASNYWSALKASKLITCHWEEGDLTTTLDTNFYFKEAYNAAEKEGIRAEEDGDFNAFYAASDKKLESTYETPFLAHAAIEPVNTTAHVKEDGSVEVWAPIQGPDGAVEETAKFLNIASDKVIMHSELLGGSFGRKAYMDFMKEAIDISRQVKAPVKLIWSREEDMTQGPFRPAMLSKMRGVIGENNRLAALSHHAIGESIQGQHWNSIMPYQADNWLSGELSKENHKYGFRVHHLSYSRIKTPIPILWWRSVYASNFAWGQECFIDEMAQKAGIDPIEARRQLLSRSPRDLKVLEKIAELNKANPLPTGHARGMAMFRSFETMGAALVEITKTNDVIKIVKVYSVLDCGQYVNPDNVKAQTEGNIAMGLSAAVKGGITFTQGKCDQTNYHQYQVMRISEMPQVEIHIIENLEKPGGVGEPGLPPIAPALGNAIFNLTKKRWYKLPIDLSAV